MDYSFSKSVAELKPSAIREILKFTSMPGYIPFAAGNPAPEALPTARIAEISASIMASRPVDALQYSVTEGYVPLRNYLKEYMKEKHNVGRDFDELIITSGPSDEIAALMGLILTNLEEEIFMKNNVRFRVIGDCSRLPESVQKRLDECMERTSKNDKMTMVVALSYSSRWEITDTMKRMAQEIVRGNMKPEDITEDVVDAHLQTSFMPDPDLMIRTGGEQRISNYLLWQCAYSEFYFCDTFWPDFDEEELAKAIVNYQMRERRYGKTSEQVAEQ